MATGEIKVELDFDFDGMSPEQMKRIKAEGLKPEKKEENDLQVGTVIAIGKKAYMRRQEMERQMGEELPYQKPPSAPTTGNQYGGNAHEKNNGDYYNKSNPWSNGGDNRNGNNWVNVGAGGNGNKNNNNGSGDNNGNNNNFKTNNNNKKDNNDGWGDWNGWGNNNNTNNNNTNVNWGNPPIVDNKTTDNLINLFGNIINQNENTKKEPVKPANNDWGTNNNKSTGWDDWKSPPSNNNRRKDDPWSTDKDPYGNNNGWDL